jgi:hypothetical protein
MMKSRNLTIKLKMCSLINMLRNRSTIKFKTPMLKSRNNSSTSLMMNKTNTQLKIRISTLTRMTLHRFNIKKRKSNLFIKRHHQLSKVISTHLLLIRVISMPHLLNRMIINNKKIMSRNNRKLNTPLMSNPKRKRSKRTFNRTNTTSSLKTKINNNDL